MNIGGRIVKRLKELNWDRRDLLDRVPDLTPQALSNLINRDSVRSEWDERIADALGVSVLWLVYVALLSLFNDQVSAARTETRQSGEDDTVRREKLVAEVYDFIRKKVPMSADEIIPQSAMAIIATPKGTRPARVPIQGKDVFAGLESAAVRTAHTIQFNLMNALLDVEVACRAKNITRMGMFILRPTTQSERWNTLVDNAIDRVLWRAPAECHFDDDTSAERLSEKIIDFSLRKAA